VTLVDREIDPKYLLDRSVRLDILANTADGTLINVEAQITNEHNIDQRTLYYWAGLYHDQLTEGKTFSELCRTVTINVLSFIWFKGDQRYYRVFHIRDEETGDLLSGDLEIYFLELRKIESIERPPQDAIEAWLSMANSTIIRKVKIITGVMPLLTRGTFYLSSQVGMVGAQAFFYNRKAGIFARA
jgi:predicted transposase/invertase (TIGR01784 family)